MNKTVTEASVCALTALFDYERTGRPEDKVRYEAAQAELESLALSQKPSLRSVPNCGSLVRSRERDDELDQMRFYARNIRAFRLDENAFEQSRPKLTLVHSD